MNKEIQQAFVDGINEVYATLFTDGVEDGINLYLLDPETSGGFYKESKVKRYKQPVLLVAKAQANMTTKSDEVVEAEVHDCPKFTVPFKALNDKEIPCQSDTDFSVLRRGYIEFHGCFYEIKNVRPATFVEDTFLTLTFECEHDLQVKELLVVETPLPEESKGDENGTKT